MKKYISEMKINKLDCKFVIYSSGAEWSEIIYWDIINYENVYFINKRLPDINCWILNKLAKLCYHNYFCNNPLVSIIKQLFYPLFINESFIDRNDKIIFLFQDWNLLSYDEQFHVFLRNKYPNAKLAFLFTNVISKSGAIKRGKLETIKNNYNTVITYDKSDSINHNIYHHPYLYSKYLEAEIDSKNDIDVFFIGHAKNRLKIIDKMYSYLSSSGLKCCFYVFGVKNEDKNKESGIIYNDWISYKDVLKLVSRSTCIMEILQEGATSITLRTEEAIIYDKKLITNNINIIDEKFYNPEYIFVINDELNMPDIGFIKSKIDVKYDSKIKDLCSPVNLLTKLYGECYN